MGKKDIVTIHLSEGKKEYNKVVVLLRTKLKERGLKVRVVSYRSSESIRPSVITVEIPGGGRVEGLSAICSRVDERLREMGELNRPVEAFMNDGALASS